MFYENWNNPVINFVSDDFIEVFILHVYDEYEDDYLDYVPKQTTKYFLNLGPISEEIMIVIHDQTDENRDDSDCDENGCFPLCYSSF